VVIKVFGNVAGEIEAQQEEIPVFGGLRVRVPVHTRVLQLAVVREVSQTTS
jgi:hypothetical protein